MVMLEFKSMTIKGIKQNGFSTGYRCKLCKRSVNVHWLVQLAHWLQSAWLFLIGSSSETPVKTKDGIGVSSDNQMRKKRDWRRLVRRQWYATGWRDSMQWFGSGWRQQESREIRRRKKRGLKSILSFVANSLSTFKQGCSVKLLAVNLLLLHSLHSLWL